MAGARRGGGLARALRRVRGLGLRGWLHLERDTLLQVVKATLAATVSWALAGRYLDSQLPALASLAAIITVQVTLYQTLTRALQYLAGVVVGVLVALTLADALGVHAWTVGIVVFGALVAGRALRLGTQANQVALSALLVVSLGSSYGGQRVADALLGATTGVVVNLLLWPPSYVGAAGRALQGVAQDLAELCRDLGARPRQAWGYPEARAWLQRARDVDAEVREAGDALDRGEESVRYNPRSRHQAEQVARYREALRALEHGASQVRGLTRTLTDLAEEGEGWKRGAGPVLSALGRTLRAAGDAARAFGRLQGDDVENWPAHRRVLGVALAEAAEGRDEAARALRELPDEPGPHGRVHRRLASVLVDLERLLSELDPDSGPHTGAVPVVASGTAPV